MTKRALVTGGAGFIGSHIVDRLVAARWQVEIIDDLSSGKRENVNTAATLTVCDVRSAEAARRIADGQFDVVVHLAAQMDVRRSVADPAFDASVNVLGTINLVEAIRQSRRDTRFVLASTGGAIYGDLATPPNREVTATNPDSPYAVSKLAAEYYLAYFGRIHGLSTVAVRYANVYGPRQDAHGEAGVVAIFCGRLLAGMPLRVFGDGLQTRDYVYVGDVAEATVEAATAQLPRPGALDIRAFNIGTGVETTVLDLASMLWAAAGREAQIEFAPARTGEQRHSSLSIEKARSVLGWAPQVPIERGLEQTFAWFADRHAPVAQGA